MPRFTLSWQAGGDADVEADDEAEAIEVLEDALEHFSSIDLESIDVTYTQVEK